MYQSDVLGRSADLHPGLWSKTRLLSERKTKYCTKSYWIKEIFIIIWRKLRKRQDNKSSQLFTVEYTCNSWYGRQFQNAEFENVSAPLRYPAISYSTGNLYRLSSEVPFAHWTEIDLGEISKSKDWRMKRKAQHTRSVGYRIQCQTKHTSSAASPTILGLFAWLKFMWHMPSWAHEGSKYLSWIECMPCCLKWILDFSVIIRRSFWSALHSSIEK